MADSNQSWTVSRMPLWAALLVALGLAVSWMPHGMADEHEELEQIETFLGIMSQYFSVIDSVYEISSDAEKSSIYQMHKIQEVYEDRGEKARMVEVLREILKQTQNPTIRNAAYTMLGDALKETGQADAAIESLRTGLAENLERAK